MAVQIISDRPGQNSRKAAHETNELRQFLPCVRFDIVFRHDSVLSQEVCQGLKYSETKRRSMQVWTGIDDLERICTIIVDEDAYLWISVWEKVPQDHFCGSSYSPDSLHTPILVGWAPTVLFVKLRSEGTITTRPLTNISTEGKNKPRAVKIPRCAL